MSDDTGGVIPPTSASNLQHEKDILMTPYLPPTILYPHPALLLLPDVALSHFDPNQTAYQVAKDFYHSSQSNVQGGKKKKGSICLFYVFSSVPLNVELTACFAVAAFFKE